MEQSWEVEQAAKLVKLARFLLTKADSRGLTHGEKHYLIQTALNLLADAQADLAGLNGPATWRNEVTELAITDIPF